MTKRVQDEKYQRDPEEFEPTFKPDISKSRLGLHNDSGDNTSSVAQNPILNYYLGKGMIPPAQNKKTLNNDLAQTSQE